MICFEGEDDKKYFLPTYGKYGYLDLLDRLVDKWNPNEEITKSVAVEFEKKLNKIVQHNVTMFTRLRCPLCKKDNITIVKRDTLLKYPVNWLKIDIESIKDL